jgi:two-component system nitrogen regulation response regulator NtrX
LENYDLKNKVNNLYQLKNNNYVANSEASKKVLNSLNKISKTECSILLSGLSGSGREFLARKIHFESNRNNKRFKVIDFSDLDKVKTEIKLFGSEEKGMIKSVGILEDVNGGTLFVKNIDKMNSKIQGKILRVLEEKKYYRIGGLSPNNINFRIISSSKMLLNDLKKCGSFSSDLLNKINFFEIMVPSIKERNEDINDLVKEFLISSLNFHKMNIENVSNDAILFFSKLVCVNNIAQLKKFIEWSVFMLSEIKNEKITKDKVVSLLNGFLNEDQTEKDDKQAYLDYNIKEARESFEKSYLTYNLKKYNNNISQVSQKIGMERTALYRKLKLLKIYASS